MLTWKEVDDPSISDRAFFSASSFNPRILAASPNSATYTISHKSDGAFDVTVCSEMNGMIAYLDRSSGLDQIFQLFRLCFQDG